MRYILITLAFLLGFQLCADAQTRRTVRRHYKSRHHRHTPRRHHQTYYRSHSTRRVTATAPSPYHGDNTPINDGQRRNKQRNLNYNTGQPLPPNNGGR